MSVFRFSIIIPAIALGCALLFAGCVKDSSLQIGERAPEISMIDLKGKTAKLSEFRGKVVVLIFWISGCRSCVAEMPVIDEISKRYKEKGLVVLAVNMGESDEKVEKFVRSLNISYPVLLDSARIAAEKYNIRAVPTNIFISRDGIAKKVTAGEITPELFEKTVDELL